MQQHHQRLLPIPLCYRLEYAREWGPCVLGLDQAVRGSLASVSPGVFCGVIVPCVHEPALDSLGMGSCSTPTALSGGEQERLTRIVQSDSYIAWLLRTIPSEMVDGARCSMGILEHTTASSIIKEVIAAGIEIRGVRISSYSDPTRFRQFLCEAFPTIDNISVYPRIPVQQSCSATSSSASCSSPSASASPCLSTPPLSPSSVYVSSPTSAVTPVPPILVAAAVIAHSARDELSRHLLFRQRHFPTPLARSPLSKSVYGPRRREHMGATASIFGDSMLRCRSCSEEESEHSTIRCTPFVGSEYGEAHCGMVSSPQQSLAQSQSLPMNMYDFYTEDDDSDMVGLTSPKRIRVVPCSPPITTVFTCEDSMPCVCPAVSGPRGAHSSKNGGSSMEHSCSPPYQSSSLFVSPPLMSSCSIASASASVPSLPTLFGMTL